MSKTFKKLMIGIVKKLRQKNAILVNKAPNQNNWGLTNKFVLVSVQKTWTNDFVNLSLRSYLAKNKLQ